MIGLLNNQERISMKISGALRHRLRLAATLILAVVEIYPAQSRQRDPIESRLNAVIGEAWANRTPGIQVGLWVPGQGTWRIAKGVSDIKRQKPMRVGMQQPIGSITKTMTGTLILQLVQEGKLSLDDKLSIWYPFAPKADQITIAMLLNMSSGVASFSQGYMASSFPETLMTRPHFMFQHEVLASHGLSLPRVFEEPGSQFDYSNTNTVLLAQIAESVTGIRYDRLLVQRIFRPLGMNRSFLNLRGGLRPPYTHTYLQMPDNSYLKTTDWSQSWAWAAGGVASTLEDGHRWATALGTGRGLTPALQLTRNTRCVLPDPQDTGVQIETYCLGLILRKDRATGRISQLYHNGSTLGAEAWLGYFPQTGASLVILVNARDDNAMNLPDRIETAIEKALPDLFYR